VESADSPDGQVASYQNPEGGRAMAWQNQI